MYLDAFILLGIISLFMRWPHSLFGHFEATKAVVCILSGCDFHTIWVSKEMCHIFYAVSLLYSPSPVCLARAADWSLWQQHGSWLLSKICLKLRLANVVRAACLKYSPFPLKLTEWKISLWNCETMYCILVSFNGLKGGAQSCFCTHNRTLFPFCTWHHYSLRKKGLLLEVL